MYRINETGARSLQLYSMNEPLENKCCLAVRQQADPPNSNNYACAHFDDMHSFGHQRLLVVAPQFPPQRSAEALVIGNLVGALRRTGMTVDVLSQELQSAESNGAEFTQSTRRFGTVPILGSEDTT
jgi:hypothetical protein